MEISTLSPGNSIGIDNWYGTTSLHALLTGAKDALSGFADLSGAAIGQTTGDKITLDTNAADYDWYIDYTPYLNEEDLPTSSPYEWKAVPGSEATVWHNPLALHSGSTGVSPASPSTTLFPATPDIAFIPVAEAQAEAAPESETAGELGKKQEQPRQTLGGVLRLGAADPQPLPEETHAQNGGKHVEEEQSPPELAARRDVMVGGTGLEPATPAV